MRLGRVAAIVQGTGWIVVGIGLAVAFLALAWPLAVGSQRPSLAPRSECECTKCGGDVDQDDRFCPRCGASVEEQIQ